MFIGVFELFSEGERKIKRFKRYASSGALVWTGENRTPGWAKILCFVFVEIQKDLKCITVVGAVSLSK